MRLIASIAVAAVFIAQPLAAQDQIRETPAGEERTAAVGGTVWEQYQFEGVPGVVIDGTVQANWGALENVNLPTGSALVILRERRLKACSSLTSFRNLGGSIWSDCLFDTDDDGKFDRVSYASAGASKVVDPPVPYRREVIEMTGDGPKNFRKVLIYTGAENGSLKLSYREFANETARAPFTEELSIPIGSTFPQDVAVKEHVITILGIDGMGLRYRLAK